MTVLRFQTCVICILSSLHCAAQGFGGPFDGSQPIDLSSGTGIASGAVSTGHAVFHFQAAKDTLLDLDVSVTTILPGTEFTDDDTLLFLFAADGQLLAHNDDADPEGLQSAIYGYPVFLEGQYFAAVTTYDNNPILDPFGRVVAWEDDGGSNVEFELLVSTQPIPEPSTMLLVTFGLLGACRTRCRMNKSR